MPMVRRAAAAASKNNRIERALGRLRLHPPGAEDLHYQLVIPYATYSPWWDDTEFRAVYGRIRGATLVDMYRCHELWRLVEQTRPLDGDILEVGVWRGGTGCLLASRCRQLQLGLTVFLADTFTGVVKATDRDSLYTGGEHADTSREAVERLVHSLGLVNTAMLVGIFPDDTGAEVADRRFRLVHVDVDVYESARGVVEWVWDRLVPGGVIVFDDYGMLGCAGVTRYVNEISSRSELLCVHNLNGHALLVKR